jgi:hypothetical protein
LTTTSRFAALGDYDGDARQDLLFSAAAQAFGIFSKLDQYGALLFQTSAL